MIRWDPFGPGEADAAGEYAPLRGLVLHVASQIGGTTADALAALGYTPPAPPLVAYGSLQEGAVFRFNAKVWVRWHLTRKVILASAGGPVEARSWQAFIRLHYPEGLVPVGAEAPANERPSRFNPHWHALIAPNVKVQPLGLDALDASRVGQ